jgi:hypothetical protein
MNSQIFLLQQIPCVPLFWAVLFVVIILLIGFVGFVVTQIKRIAAIFTIVAPFWMSTMVLSWLRGNSETTLCTIGLSSRTMEIILLSAMTITILLSVCGVIMRTIYGDPLADVEDKS